MNHDQRIVALGASTGVMLMIWSLYFLYQVLPDPSVTDLASTLAFTLKVNALGLIPLFILIAQVGNQRFLSDAIDPLRHKENQRMEVDGRVVDNTMQQQFVFFVGTLALSTLLQPGQMKLITAMAIVFVAARIIFWIGYHINPLYRAPGMAATAYMNLGILVTVAVLFLF
jgi:hypothetical protein